MRGGRAVYVFPVAERVHGLGRLAEDSDLALDSVTVQRIVRAAGEVSGHEPTGPRGQQLEREHGRGH